MNATLRTFARHYGQVVAFCCAIAVLTHLIWPAKTYLMQVGYALSVGTITWAVIEFGRFLVPARHCHPDSGHGRGWPTGWRGLALTGVGIACGLLLGDPLGDQLFGMRTINTTRDNQLSLAITLLAGAVASFYFHSRGRAASLAAKITAAERDANEARLKLLETQLEPHMLFNTLANLRVLIGSDPARAQHMLDHLIDYLRATLNASRHTTHPLRTEFERLDDYLALMAIRMGPRLAYALNLPPALAQVPVPTLLLQPLVENSIRHGLEPQVAGGRIEVNARADGAWLVLTVRDTGAGLDPAQAPGFGLSQVRERLVTAYGPGAVLQAQAPENGGTLVTLRLPLNQP